MALQLPAAPANFYAPSLTTIKDKLAAKNGSSTGRLALLTAPPISIDNAWNEVGVAFDSAAGANQGSLVVGHQYLTAISAPEISYIESGGEKGYKVKFSEVKDIPVYIDGSGTATAIVVGIALIEGVDAFSYGINDNVKYIIRVDNLTVTDGKLITLPEFEITINYSEIDTGL